MGTFGLVLRNGPGVQRFQDASRVNSNSVTTIFRKVIFQVLLHQCAIVTAGRIEQHTGLQTALGNACSRQVELDEFDLRGSVATLHSLPHKLHSLGCGVLA